MTDIALTTRSPATARPGETQNHAQLRQAAEAFEAIFLRQIIGGMRQASLGEDLFGSQATEQFREMADAQLANSMASQGSFGIAEMLIGQFTRQANATGTGPGVGIAAAAGGAGTATTTTTTTTTTSAAALQQGHGA